MIAAMWAYYITLCINETIMYNIHINPKVPKQSSLPHKVNETHKGIECGLSPTTQMFIFHIQLDLHRLLLRLSDVYVAPLRYMWLEELVNIETYSPTHGWQGKLKYVWGQKQTQSPCSLEKEEEEMFACLLACYDSFLLSINMF